MTNGTIPPGAGFSITETEADGGKEDCKKLAQRERLLEAVLAAGVAFFHDLDGTAFATVPGPAGSLAYYRVGSRRFESVARAIYSNANRRTVGSQNRVIPGSVSATVWKEVVPSFEAMALEGPTRPVDVRVIQQGSAVWLDLGGDDWQGVRITAEGWQVVPRIEAPLIRPESLRALPMPARSHDALGDLAGLLNFTGGRDGRDMKLAAAWLVAVLYPKGPYPILALDGEAGAGKSTACRMLRQLVDPNKANLRAPPRGEDHLLIAASSARVVVLDNVSYIEADTADALSRLATGSGLSKRRLFTDGEEHVVSVARPILLNGIPSLLARADLADRALAITLPAIPDAKRRPEAEVWRGFESAAPGILALLLDAVVTALRNLPALRLDRLPRMADFARLACAAAPAFGWTVAEMLDAIEGSRENTVGAVIEADPMAVAVCEMMEPSEERPNPAEWTGTASELLNEVNHRVPFDAQRERGWPKDGARFSGRLRRIASALRQAGVEVVLPTTGGRAGRRITIKRRNDARQRSERSLRSSPSGSGACRNASAGQEHSQVPVTIPERSAPGEQGQELSPHWNAGNAGNAPAPTEGDGYL